MDVTLAEFAATADPAITRNQAGAIVILAQIPPAGHRQTGRSGRRARTYGAAALAAAHAEEAARTSRPFENGDWIAAALLARHLVVVDIAAGAIWWLASGDRAETLGTGNYGWVRVGRCLVAAHRLIWMAAEGEIPPGMQINHVNRLRWNNGRANLDLVSHAENMRHMAGAHYFTRDQAIRELAELDPPEEPDSWRELMRAPGGEPAMPPGTPIKSQVNRSRVCRH